MAREVFGIMGKQHFAWQSAGMNQPSGDEFCGGGL
jgi:hypothetical protein